MTCSLQLYRQRIGTYLQKTNFKNKKPVTSKTSCLRPRHFCSFLLTMFGYCVGIFFLPYFMAYCPSSSAPNSYTYSCPITSPLVTSVCTFTSAKSVKVLKPPEKWDPWSGRGCTVYSSSKDRNKMVHMENGNRGKRGKGLTCLYWNKGPSLLINKHQDLESVIADHHPHVLGLGEANYSQAQDIEAVQFPGYNLHLDSGLGLQGMARVAVYTHNTLKVKRRNDLEDPDTAAIWMECGLPGQRGILICVGYRQWRLLGQGDNISATVAEQLARWNKFINRWESALSEGKEIIVMLDANLDFLTWRNTDHLEPHHSSIRLKSLVDTLFDRIIPLGVSQLVTGATRMERGSPSTGLDHLYSNRADKLSPVQTIYTGMSDHKLLKCQRFTKSLKQHQRYVKKRSFKHFEKADFKQRLNHINLDEVLHCTEVDSAVEMLTGKLNFILDTVAPIKTFQTRSQYAPWMSEETKHLKKLREEAQEKASKSNKDEDWRFFKSIRNQVTARSRADKKKWEEKKLENTDDMWKTVKNWLGWKNSGPPTQLFFEGRVVTKPAGLASSMNKFFIDKVKSLRQNIPQVARDPLKEMKEAMQLRQSMFQLQPVTVEEVGKLIKSLKSSSATGMDYIDTNIIKLAADQLAPILTFIVNLSIQTSTFPSSWKWHKVIPLLKSTSADPLLPKSYRPVALLPIMSKILEKAIFNQLVQYLESNELIHPNLHGSRAGHSTATALGQLYDTWVEEVEEGKMVGVLLCDQSAAFDLCDHYLLVEKMKLMGVDEHSATWFWSYLTGRRQSCSVDGQVSPALNIPSCGVPQGSIGGPILWLLFTCDQPDVFHEHEIDSQDPSRGCGRDGVQGLSVEDEGVQGQGVDDEGVQGEVVDEEGGQQINCGELVGYVDDGAYSYSDSNPLILSQVLTRKFSMLEQWMHANKLVINPDKTHLLVMGSRKHRDARTDVSVNASGHTIRPTVTEKLLGGQLHQSLTWNLHLRDHRTSLTNQLSNRINGLRRVGKNADFSTKLKIANGIVISKLTYLITVWGGAQEYLLSALQVQQLAAARIVCGFESKFWSKRKLLNKTGWLSVRQLVFYHTVLQTCKTMRTKVPKPLFQSLSSTFPYRTRSADTGQIRQSQDFNQKSFKFRARQFHNRVPSEVRTGSIETVKKNLKQWVKSNIPID